MNVEGETGMREQHHDTGIVKRTSKPIGQSTFDVIVIGGGIIGCSIALALVERGSHVAIVERQWLGSEASVAAIGGLTPQSDEFTRGSLRQFALDSVKAYPGWLDHLADLTGIHVEYHSYGQLEVAFDEREVANLEEHLHEWEREQFDVQRLSAEEVLQLEPLVNPEVLAGCHLRGEPHLNPVMLLNAVAAALHRQGCEVFEGYPVIEVMRSKGQVTGVKLFDGRVLSAKWVVLAAGAWSGHILGVPPCPVYPVKGQALLARLWSQPFRHHIHASPGYIVPRTDGHLVLGVTYEEAGYDKRVTVGGLHEILNTTMRLSRAVGECEVITHWAGLRPRTSDQKPILGVSSEMEGLIFATGHFGLGITLAPITARLIAEIIMEATFPEQLQDYSPDRFRRQGKAVGRRSSRPVERVGMSERHPRSAVDL